MLNNKITKKQAIKYLSRDVLFLGSGNLINNTIDTMKKIKSSLGSKRTFKKITSKGVQYNESFLDMYNTVSYQYDNLIFVFSPDIGENYACIYKI